MTSNAKVAETLLKLRADHPEVQIEFLKNKYNKKIVIELPSGIFSKVAT
jgi:hypothetical protein